MAHIIQVIKANSLKDNLILFQNEKKLRLFGKEDESDSESEKGDRRKKKPKTSLFGKCLKRFTTPGTAEYSVSKSFIGFMGGVLLAYVFFVFFQVAIKFPLKPTTYVCGLAGIFLCLGMAFSSKVRCYVLLLIPVFFSRQGRQALVAYALFLAFTGPAKNTMHNMGILSDSMTCGQETIKRTLKQIMEMVKAPFKSIKETLDQIMKAVRNVIEVVKGFVMKIKRIIVSVLKVIKKATSWLGNIINFCNKKVGTPFERCMRTFDDAIIDCKAKLGVVDFMCHVVHIVKALCYTVKWLDFICMFTEFVSDKVIGVVKRKLREFGIHMKNLFYVSIEFTHSYEFETTASNSTVHVAKTILQKISAKMEKLQNIIGLCGFMFSFLFLFIFFKVYYYKYKYMTSDRYDNFYISKYITELDLRRAEMDRETVLPLEPREKRLYAKPSALRLLKEEKSRMTHSMFLLSLTSFKVISFLLCDYSLFWVLMTVYEAGHGVEEDVEKPKVGLHVEGNGVLANFYRDLGGAFEVPENPNMRLNPLHCLPDPVPPDTGRYMQIGFLLGLSWFLTVMEAYGLRLRSIVMSHYYPDRAKERAVWLYNHILRSRGSFVRFARRQLRKKFGDADSDPIEKVTLKQRIFASFPLLAALFGKSKENACLLCSAPETKANPLKKCKTPNCRGRFCAKCFAKLQNICTLCQHPIEYGDVSDISEEIDSSEEDFYARFRPDSSSPESDAEDKYTTFKDMELRDRFRDVEANRQIDYSKLSDLYDDKAALRRRVKEAVQKRIRTLEAAKMKTETERGKEYRRIKNGLQDIIERRRRRMRKVNVNSNDAFIEREREAAYDGEESSSEGAALLPEKRTVSWETEYKSSPFRSRRRNHQIAVPRTKYEYEMLKDKVRQKIKVLKENNARAPNRNEEPQSLLYFRERRKNSYRPSPSDYV